MDGRSQEERQRPRFRPLPCGGGRAPNVRPTGRRWEGLRGGSSARNPAQDRSHGPNKPRDAEKGGLPPAAVAPFFPARVGSEQRRRRFPRARVLSPPPLSSPSHLLAPSRAGVVATTRPRPCPAGQSPLVKEGSWVGRGGWVRGRCGLQDPSHSKDEASERGLSLASTAARAAVPLSLNLLSSLTPARRSLVSS